MEIARLGFVLLALLQCRPLCAVEDPAVAAFKKNVEPILIQHCYDCHGDGMNKGDVAFDDLAPNALLDHSLWTRVLKNVRAGLMPPADKPRLSAEHLQVLEHWIKRDVFRIDPENIDPGRVTLRRLNRVEYRNTIRDLMGIDFNAEEELPADDTGYGFDTIGDVLTVSPMLLEKYISAANEIVNRAVPTVSRVMPERVIPGNRFRSTGGDRANARQAGYNRTSQMLPLPFGTPASVETSVPARHAGTYRIVLNLAVRGTGEQIDAQSALSLKVDGKEQWRQEFGWHENETFRIEIPQQWTIGERALRLDWQPSGSLTTQVHALELRLVSVAVRGPVEERHWTKPANYDRFFPPNIPSDHAQRRALAGELLEKFATRAFRRPADRDTVDRLVSLAESVYTQPEKTFEAGIAHAMAAALSSPRFLFRFEESAPGTEGPYAPVDEYALASRLSYFLWSTMPDDELFRLASRGVLRKNLRAQVARMLADPRADALVENFTGQWLRLRDLDGISINGPVVLARDAGRERELRRNRGRLDGPRIELDGELRLAMRRETELVFTTVMRENRSVIELLDADYTFLNEKLASLYGIPGVSGAEMRKVQLPEDSPRGGVLTHASVLVVTSNPDRTSPVKRGLFILDNILGTPAPPPPANVPALEAAETEFKDRLPTLRESLEAHRADPMCASCHRRMDPLGLAFENFNALGMWREQERNQPIDATGRLITGESFSGVRELKRLLADEHRRDLYRCLTEKLLTYALGRGLEYYDTETVDRIVRQLEADDGRFQPLLFGIVESAAFQKRRAQAAPASEQAARMETPDRNPVQIAERSSP
ncbi:MAG TPA: DUF1592 domain-containing protein [Verrucomicrobia bacterium]|nr:DUF1592 domain-containing protein [Verrucomicrobiota bacterium]